MVSTSRHPQVALAVPDGFGCLESLPTTGAKVHFPGSSTHTAYTRCDLVSHYSLWESENRMFPSPLSMSIISSSFSKSQYILISSILNHRHLAPLRVSCHFLLSWWENAKHLESEPQGSKIPAYFLIAMWRIWVIYFFLRFSFFILTIDEGITFSFEQLQDCGPRPGQDLSGDLPRGGSSEVMAWGVGQKE
jgi:hypothetical protein